MHERMDDVTPRLPALVVALAHLGGCGATSEAPSGDNPSGGGGARYARASDPGGELLELYAETYRFEHGRPRAIEVLPDGSGVLFLRSGPRSPIGDLYFFDARAGQERRIATAAELLGQGDEELSAEERARRERMRLSARGIASFVVSPDGAKILVPLSGRLFLVDRARIGQSGAVRELPGEGGNAIDPRFSPDGARVACVRAGDLYVIDLATGAQRRLTTKRGPDVENGLAEFVAQEEMSRMQGYWWAPDGGALVYQETDHAGMERMHILDPMHPESEPASWPYPRPGQRNASVRLGVIPVGGGETRFVEWDRERYPYLATVRWSEGAPLTLLVQNREQQEEVLLAADASTGRTRELLRETDAAWLNLEQAVPRWLADGQRFLWSSERGGEDRLELRDAGGQLVRALTPEGFGYRGLITVDEERGVAWVRAGAEPTEQHIFRIPIDGGAPERMTQARGEHDAFVAKNGALWVHVPHTLDGDRQPIVRRLGGEEAGRLRVDAEPIPFEPNLTFETVGEREWRAVIVRPRDFDPSLVYPVILHVYGGPGVRNVTAARDRFLLSQWHADHGFIVVTIDGRGTPARGREWERAIRGDFITVPLEDQIAALRAIGEAHPELDMERVGVWGWSFGGYFSAMATLRRPDVFRAGVAGAPVSEWRDYDTHYTERYLGLPEADGQEGAYARSSVLTYAAERAGPEQQRPLLIIHGTADDNVYFSHALKLQNALFRAGRPADLLALSGLTHMVPEPEIMRRMHERLIGFFERHLRR